MIISRIIYLFVIGLFLINTSAGFATSSSNAVDIGALGPSTNAPKKIVEQTYTQVSYDNLYKLAWSYDAFSINNNEALLVYLMITECTLYNKFFQNEFEWEKIRIATREFLKNNKDKVPRYYEYVQPIKLGRYDYSLQGFPIIDSKDFKGQKNLQFASYSSGQTNCGKYSISAVTYPAAGVISISSPFNLSFIRAPLALAQKYIEWRTRLGIANADERQAYIRYRIRIDGYDGIKVFDRGANSFAFHGKLMRIDVFADQEMLLPLYNQVY